MLQVQKSFLYPIARVFLVFTLWMIDDGSNVMLLTDTLSPSNPRWLSDGKQIVFSRRVIPQDELRSHIFLMNADGTDIRQVTEPHAGYDSNPSFSHDGKSIVFHRYERINNQNSKHSISVMNLESGGIRQIYDRLATSPDWSPGGKHIVFSSRSVGGSGDNIYILESVGDEVRDLLPPAPPGDLSIDRRFPRWSTDGKWILYIENEFMWEERNQRTCDV